MAEDIIGAAEGLLRRFAVEPHIVRSIVSQLRQDFGGSAHYVQRVDREARDTEIADLLAKGVSPQGIARHLKVHPATVRRKRSAWL